MKFSNIFQLFLAQIYNPPPDNTNNMELPFALKNGTKFWL